MRELGRVPNSTEPILSNQRPVSLVPEPNFTMCKHPGKWHPRYQKIVNLVHEGYCFFFQS